MVTLSSPGPPAPSRSALRCSAAFRRFFLRSFRSRRPSSSNPLPASPRFENSLPSAPFLSVLSSSPLTRPVCHTQRQRRRAEERAGHESDATNSFSTLPSSPLARPRSRSHTLSAFFLFPSSSVSCVPTGSSASPLGQSSLLSPSSSPASLCSFVLGRRNWSLSPATGLGAALARKPAVRTADLASGVLPLESSRFLEQTAGISSRFSSASETKRRLTASASAFASRFSSYAQADGEAQRRATPHFPEFAQVFSASQAHAFRDFSPSTLGAASPPASPP
ncbi:iron-sulfur cluster protein ISCA, partial [Toxoplasma gondii RUB]